MWKPDAYYVIARLSPAIVLFSPMGVTIWATYPEGWPGFPHQIYYLLVPVVSFPLSAFVRTKGRHIQKQLWATWGGSPLAIALAASKNESTGTIRDRAVVRLSELFPDVLTNDGSASECETVTSLIAAHTTDIGTHVIASENQAYGFYRNSYGIRRMGIITSAGCILVSGLAFLHSQQADIWPALGLSGVVLAWWIFGVKESVVREAGDRYADAVVRWLASNPSD